MADENVEKINRILYVEPNDVYNVHQKKSDGSYETIPLNIPYEDLCIAFNLLVDVYPRFKPSVSGASAGEIQENGERKFQLSWVSTDRFNPKENFSFLRGDDFGKGANEPTYLTTYYTDISFDTYGTKKIVEGLGVENIQVNFESWYTPTVTIKFVDVRGSAIWGNEEAIHENGSLTADNIFGCFMTMPYPQFKLQIKGFLGKPVTYQLTCSNFKGSYNAQTGNFEAVVTFIGYTYSLLTDIPMEYLVAAPFCPFVGRDYWRKHASTSEWALDDGSAPPTLDTFFRKIERAQKEYDSTDIGISTYDSEELASISNEKKLLRDISDYLNSFVNGFKRIGDSCFDTIDSDGKRQIVCFFEKGNAVANKGDAVINIDIPDGVQTAYDNFYTAVDTYNKCFVSKPISVDVLPNKWQKCNSSLTAVRKFEITKDEKTYKITNISIYDFNGDVTTSNLMKIPFNENKNLTQDNAKLLYNGVLPPDYNNDIKRYAYILDLYTLSNLLKERSESLLKREKDIVRKVNEKLESSILKIVGFKPYIGNVFKIIMCHLETFVHIMMEAANEIYSQGKNGGRSASALGVFMDKTDVIGSNTIPPWPSVFNNGSKTNDGGDINESANVFAWVGDFSHNFVEEEVILGLQSAVQRIVDNSVQNEKPKEYNHFPLLPSDFNQTNSPYSNIYENTDVSSLSGYISIRAAQLLNILNDSDVDSNMAKLMAKMDACNYYNGINSYITLKKDIFERIGSGNNSDTLIGISTCDEAYDRYGVYYDETEKSVHTFETVDKTYYSIDRHPMISESKTNSNYYLFSHYYTNNLISLIPSKIEDYSYYKESFSYVDDDNYLNTSFTADFDKDEKRITAKNWLYNSDSTKLVAEEDYERYVNIDMFNIISKSNSVNYVNSLYNDISSKSGGIEIGNYTFTEDITPFVKKYWKLDNDAYSQFYEDCSNMLSLNLKQLKVDENKLFAVDLYNKFPEDITDNSSWLDNESNSISFGSDGKWFNGANEVSLDDLCVQQFIVKHNVNSDGCIFGCPFYYMQNGKLSIETDDGESMDRSQKVKALLFLHCFKYDYSRLLNVFDYGKLNGAVENVPYGYLLLLGALLWRYRFIKKNGIDPIIYDESSYHYKKAYNGNGYENTLFIKDGKKYSFVTIKSNDVLHDYNVPIYELFGGTKDKWEIDINIENQLVEFFTEFCEKEFSRISSECEIKNQFIYEDGSVRQNDFTFSTLLHKIQLFNRDENRNFIWLRDNIIGWIGNYRMITFKGERNPEIFNMLLNDNDELQKLFKKLYCQKVVIVDSNHRRLGKSNDRNISFEDQVIIRKNIYRDYVSSFINQLREMTENDEKLMSNPSSNLAGSEKIVLDKNISTSMYYHLKNLWDKWLLVSEEDRFDVKNFFKKNFFFIDSFYRNTYNLLPLNCQKILDDYNGLDKNGSLFSFMNNLISDHRCIFFALPDYIGFDGNTYETDIKLMEELFKPMPYNKMPAPSLDNKFVIIYTHKPSEVSSENTNYKWDGFDIWSRSSGTSIAPDIFKTQDIKYNSLTERDEVSRIGYNVPSFGVSLNRQNNHVFKDIKLDMNNPVMTDQAIQAFSNIIEMGKTGERKIMFHGQDIYNIYSSYSFICEVEMIGNAQICPLMYFQLLNIPMWRGTYMIFNVTHTMTPGNMVTRFKGMKMAATPVPFSTSFFSEIGEYKTIDDIDQNIGDDTVITDNSGSSNSGQGTYDMIDNETYFESVNPADYYHMEENRRMGDSIREDTYKGNTIDPDLVDLFNKLFEEISMLDENKPVRKWNIFLSHALRRYETNPGGSDHYKGNAIDIKIMRYDKNGDKPVDYVLGGNYQPELLKVMDILYTNHRNEFNQAILEYKTTNTMKSDTVYNFHVLHISSNRGKHKGSHQMFIASADKNYGSINKNCKTKEWFLENVPDGFKSIAKKVYYNDRTYFNNFNNYVTFGNYTNSELRAHFGENVFAKKFNDIGYTKSNGNLSTKLNNPGSLRKLPNELWLGEVRPNDSGFVKFENMYYGTRALFLNMNTQITRGHNTISKLINVWAPPSENDTKQYIYNVCKGANVSEDTLLTNIIDDKDLCVEIARQIAIAEDGIKLTDECLQTSYDMACKYIRRKMT